ncbi:hypothetical protein JF66_19625 [Cryobacterium sp. MLB-32]|uniref:hypothetical protein n=1 Tax=Cryobacterium sp. MLB-32 TaxID=1529318 RepID=UPI0004E63849|nr:hypothetical protein [Cryobacterium sp. MLB-32]KFF58289.1 hypothetical protein JF66_19625 [Cryobacterium sp. MLB-32]
MNADDFFALVTDFFGTKASRVQADPAGPNASWVLYDSFVFMCGLDGEHGTFRGGIEYDTGKYLTVFLNERLSFNTDRESVLRNLQIVDRYCRLRLPDKFLLAYDAE